MAVKPKMCMIPSGYKGGASSGDLYSVLPSDGVGDFDFSRSGSATRINKDGLIETVSSNVPRLNYPLIDGVVSGCPSLLLEPLRRNLFLRSEEFDNAYWTKTQSTISENSIISPDGSINADKLQTNTSSAEHSVLSSNISIVNGTTYTVSLFAKAAEKTFLFIGWNSAGFGSPSPSFLNLINGEYQAGAFQTVTVTKFPNGWYKFSTTRTATATSSSNTGFRIGLCDSLLTSTTIGQNTTDGIYIWGAQLEDAGVGVSASYPTSYIPTSGSQATRSAETCNNSGDANTFNDSEGVLMAEISALAESSTYRFISLSDGTLSNRVSLFLSNNNTLNGSANGVSSIASVVDIKNNNKVAYKYKSGDYSLWVNGFEVGTLTVTNGNHSNLNRLNFDYGQGSDDFYGNTKQIQYFDTALTDTDLEQLTSWSSFNEMATSQLYSIQ